MSRAPPYCRSGATRAEAVFGAGGVRSARRLSRRSPPDLLRGVALGQLQVHPSALTQRKVAARGLCDAELERISDQCVADGHFIEPAGTRQELCQILKVQVVSCMTPSSTSRAAWAARAYRSRICGARSVPAAAAYGSVYSSMRSAPSSRAIGINSATGSTNKLTRIPAPCSVRMALLSARRVAGSSRSRSQL